MLPMSGISPAGAALNGYGGGALQHQVDENSEALRRKRAQEARVAGYSPAGQMLALDYGSMSVPGAL